MSLRETVTGVGSCPAAAAEIVFQTGAVQMIEYLRFASLRAVGFTSRKPADQF